MAVVAERERERKSTKKNSVKKNSVTTRYDAVASESGSRFFFVVEEINEKKTRYDWRPTGWFHNVEPGTRMRNVGNGRGSGNERGTLIGMQ